MSIPTPIAIPSTSTEMNSEEAVAEARHQAAVAGAQADLYRRLLNAATEEAAGLTVAREQLLRHVEGLQARIDELEGAAAA